MSWQLYLALAFLVWGAAIGLVVFIVHVWEESYHRFMQFCEDQDRRGDA